MGSFCFMFRDSCWVDVGCDFDDGGKVRGAGLKLGGDEELRLGCQDGDCLFAF